LLGLAFANGVVVRANAYEEPRQMKRKKMESEKTELRRGRKGDTGQRTETSAWALTGVLLATAVGVVAPAAVAAQGTPTTPATREATHEFEIAGGKLSEVLAAFARTTGLQILDPAAAVTEQVSRGIVGRHSAQDALRTILEGSGVSFRFANARTVRLAPTTNTLENVTVVGSRIPDASSAKYTEPVRDIPQSITVVPQAVLAAQGVTSLRDAVRNVTGLTVNAGEGGATPGDNFNIRGFSARSDVFVNGVRDVGGYSREVFNIEQIEVTKGPASVYSGRGSTGGSINLVTKTPHLRPDRFLSVGAGTAEYKRTTLDVNQPLNGLGGTAVRLNAQWQDTGVDGLDVIKNQSWGVAPSLALGLGSATNVTVDFMHARQDNTPSYGYNNQTTNGPPAEIDPHKYFGIRNLDFEKVVADQGSLRVMHSFNASTTLRNQTSIGQSDVKRIVSSANPDGTRRAPSHITFDHNISNQTVLSTAFNTGGVGHALVSGVEMGRERSRFASYVLTGALPRVDNLSDPEQNDVFTGTIREGRPRRSAVASSVGVYTFDTMKLNDHFEISGGLRYDVFSPQFSDSMGVDLPKVDSRAVTWRAGTVFKPSEQGSFYAAYGTSFNPTGELLSLDSRGSLGLGPEKNRSAEVGTKWDVLSSRLLVTMAAFRTEKTNARITDPNDPSGATIILAGEQRIDGFELGASGRLTDRWSLFGGWSWLDGKIVRGNAGQNGTALLNTPKHTLNIWSTAQLPWHLEVGGGVRHVGDRLRSATQTVPAYWAYDADVMMPVGKNVEVRVNLINITDETYFDSGRYWVPASGRSIRVTSSVRF
jgi:catecholate siderophore receptor